MWPDCPVLGQTCAGHEAAGTGAGDGIRTRDINLGKVALYQLSYSRAATEPPYIFPPRNEIVNGSGEGRGTPKRQRNGL